MLKDCDVFTASTADEAFSLAGKHDFDTVLLDLAQDVIDPEATVALLNSYEPNP